MDLAVLLGKTKQEVQRGTTSTEFVDWIHYMNLKANEQVHVVEKIDYYLAQIAHQVFLSRNPKSRLSLDKFLLKFKRKQDHKPPNPEAALQQSKSAWAAILGGVKGKK